MMIEGSGSIPLTSGFGSRSRRPKNMWIRWNTVYIIFLRKKIKKKRAARNSRVTHSFCKTTVSGGGMLMMRRAARNSHVTYNFCKTTVSGGGRVGKNPFFFLKNQPSGFFWFFLGFLGFFGFFWVFLPGREGS
jgi:hypothetical protein